MFFASAGFLFLFLPLFMLAFMVTPDRWKRYTLFAAGVLFYLLANWRTPLSVAILWFAVLFAYFYGAFLARHRRPVFLALGIAVNVLVFLFLRIFCNQLRGSYLFLFPVGASIFLLNAISYLLEHYRAEEAVEDNLLDTATYLTFFPVMMAGPLIPYRNFRLYLTKLTYKKEIMAKGARFFSMGLIKRVAVAAVLCEAYGNILQYSNLQVNVGIGLLSFFLMYLIVYFAFSGYSDMGVGLCVMMGIPVGADYRSPFSACAPSDYFHGFFSSFYRFFETNMIKPLEGCSFGSARGRRFLGECIYLVCFALWLRTDFFVLLALLPILALVALERLTAVGEFLHKKVLGRAVGWLLTLLLTSLFWMVLSLESFGALFEYFRNLLHVSGSYLSLYTFVTSIGMEFIVVAAVAVCVLLPLSRTKCYLSGKSDGKAAFMVDGMLTLVLLGLLFLTLSYFLPQFPKYAVQPYTYFVI